MDCKISVIIATYNTADYLKECLDSIFYQTLKDIEVIVVDDGSTDNTALILKEYCKKYNNLVRLYQENQGAGIARNYGIICSKGEYMIFMDPDDKYPCEDCLEKLYVSAEKHKVAICGGNIISNDNGVIKNWYLAGEGNVEHIKSDVIDVDNCYFLYGHQRYLFKTSLIKENRVEYAGYRRYEDQVFTIKALGIAKKIYELDYPVYEYRVNHKQWEMEEGMFYDVISGFRDTLRLIIEYNMRFMFEKNYWNFMIGQMPSITQYVFCGNTYIDKVMQEINGLVIKSGWDYDETYIITQQQVTEYRKAMIAENERLTKVFSEEKPIIIYGAGNNTVKLVSRYKAQMQNVVGIAVTQQAENRLECEEFPVRSIDSYISYKEKAIVLITPSKKLKNEITDILENLGFKKYEWIDVRMIK